MMGRKARGLYDSDDESELPLSNSNSNGAQQAADVYAQGFPSYSKRIKRGFKRSRVYGGGLVSMNHFSRRKEMRWISKQSASKAYL